MTTSTENTRIDFVYVWVSAFAVIVSWLLHELAHWAAGTYLGYEMIMTINTTYPLNESYTSTSDTLIISAAGPLFTLAEAVVVFLIMRKNHIVTLYIFLFTCFYMRLLAFILSFINPNDEARISQSLGIGTFTLPLLMVGLLYWLLYITSRNYKFGKKFNLINLGLVLLFSSLIILSDKIFKLRLI